MNIDADIRKVLEAVTDPEIPVISIEELGILREIVQEKNSITVFISPTYSGCPAMDIIAFDIKKAMAEKGYQNVEVKYQRGITNPISNTVHLVFMRIDTT